MQKAKVSAIVLSQKKDKKLKNTLDSLTWCQQVIVINKPEIKDFSKVRNLVMKKATQPWILYVDSDEIVTDQLAQEIKSSIKSKKINGFYLKRQDVFLGKTLNFGETANVRFIRLAQKNTGKWLRPVHEVWQIKGKTQTLRYPLLHYPHDSINKFYHKVTKYAQIEADFRIKTNPSSQSKILLQLLLFPPLKFIFNYIFRLGFLDGFPGLVMASMMSLHSALVRINLYHAQQNN